MTTSLNNPEPITELRTVTLKPEEFENRLAKIREANEALILACRSVHWANATDESILKLAHARKNSYAALVGAVGRAAVKKATRPRNGSNKKLNDAMTTSEN